jgi:hypothetical protein
MANDKKKPLQRYWIAEFEQYQGNPTINVRFIYDNRYKRFVLVQVKSSQGWTTVKKINDENFYVYFPGHAKNLRNSNNLPNWA